MTVNLSRSAVAGATLVLALAWLSTTGGAMPAPQAPVTAATTRPNIVVFLVDDMGYADVAVNGHPSISTPNIDDMAKNGIHLTSFYSSPLCTPTRGMFLTSRYPVRTGLLSPTGPGHPGGMRDNDVTLAEALKAQGYRTAMFGKWHLGDFETTPGFNPTTHGFDRFLGIPYSHDYNPPAGVPLFRDTTIVERPVVPEMMTQRFTEEATRFIRESGAQPFFVYVAHPMPHIPVAASPAFSGRSRAGRYGDVIEELDWSVGEVARVLRELKLDRNTITVFMSDNGPWLSVAEQTYDRAERGIKVQGDVGWSGVFRASKGTTFEGGVRVPALVTWPEAIPAGQRSAELVSVMDLYPTFVHAAGGEIPADYQIDGIDVMPLLRGAPRSPRREVFHFSGANLQAVRRGAWKLRIGPPEATAGRGAGTPEPELFNIEQDPAERHNVAAANPALVEELRARMTALTADMPPVAPAQ